MIQKLLYIVNALASFCLGVYAVSIFKPGRELEAIFYLVMAVWLEPKGGS